MIRIILLTNIILWFSHSGYNQELHRFEYEKALMGTHFRLILYAEDKIKADQASRLAFHRVEELNQVFSDYVEDSEISRLSKSAGSGKYVSVSNDMWELLNLSKRIARESDGAFDITAGPLTKLWRRAIRRDEIPTPEQINKPHKLVNQHWLEIDSAKRSVQLKYTGMRLDMGGIAKGYAIDEAYSVLRAQGIEHVLVDGGGDLYAGLAPPGKRGWKILLRADSSDQENYIWLREQALASSGDTFKFLEHNGQRFSHIIDPRTGYGVLNGEIVHVLAANCTQADGLASAIAVLGKGNASELLCRFPEAQLLKH